MIFFSLTRRQWTKYGRINGGAGNAGVEVGFRRIKEADKADGADRRAPQAGGHDDEGHPRRFGGLHHEGEGMKNGSEHRHYPFA